MLANVLSFATDVSHASQSKGLRNLVAAESGLQQPMQRMCTMHMHGVVLKMYSSQKKVLNVSGFQTSVIQFSSNFHSISLKVNTIRPDKPFSPER